ncbi:hydroxylysine kinase /5-phosphonooxy-L-lysine phospho-lyase [Kribbella rubisoli]|uniref:Hydroxylysine kinase /5-phosphonooxy-L-lysine phospho-lyase n=1 Tax=Kribbella rubisoli TaxID=3075929 RepID=A0A4Q7WM77_9ACTN|nr:aminotransferase class III-fold pyridoxal phosphate-dependent enzyme [Kribbella rubisoli]RZU11192.1 hydroxylysine kinase /5-phosphonooxy-L-lysine phospho-lyase [Kribbella rubisoli]
MSILESSSPVEQWNQASIAEVLAQEFGLRAVAQSPLGGEVDQNVAVDLADGSRVVVKVSSPGADPDEIRWRHALQTLAARPGVLGPVHATTAIASRNGDTVVPIDRDGTRRIVTVQPWLPGRTLSDLNSHSPQLLGELGLTAARMVQALAPATALPGATTRHWDVLRSPEAIAEGIEAVEDPARQAQVREIVGWFDRAMDSHAAGLPRSVVHQDLNDFNVLARPGPDGRHHVHAVLDFADALHTARIGELAVAVAYAMLRKKNPLSAATAVIRGYAAELELTEDELAVLYPLAAARLCVNAVTWTKRQADGGTSYGHERMKHTWPAIALIATTPPEVGELLVRMAAGAAVEPGRPAPGADAHKLAALDLVPFEPAHEPVGQDDRARLGRHLSADAGTVVRRTTEAGEAGEAATLRLGIELASSEPFQVVAPHSGVVQERGAAYLILRHEADETIWSRWTGLDSPLSTGVTVARGEPIGTAHTSLRVAIFRSLETAKAGGRLVTPSEAAAWAIISPDPSDFLGLGAQPDPAVAWTANKVLATRNRRFARSQRSYYDRPMQLVGGRGAWLYDEFGRGYLDAMNNVSHVGHSNPRVVEAATAQMWQLNTNSRFLYRGIAEYAERLTALLPDPLEVVFLVCSGSEANDLAVRIARTVTGRNDVLVVDGAYHGNTSVLTGLSPNRYKGPGGTGPDPTTHEVQQPNRYRGPFGYDDPDAGSKYAADVRRQVDRLTALGTPPAAFIAESAMGTAGSIFYPDGYLEQAHAHVRAAGGLCIADEVQVGFGRFGDVFWGFEGQGVVPDIVTMGKPIGNGHPMAAVVTTREIADAFDTGMRYFNTFGGNPVSCAIGTAVLDEISERGLQARAAETGRVLDARLGELAGRHALIGDVRAHGMYVGIELVRDRATKEPAPQEALLLSELMKDEGMLVYPTGPAENVLKIKPPLAFTPADAELFTEVLDEVLTRDW